MKRPMPILVLLALAGCAPTTERAANDTTAVLPPPSAADTAAPIDTSATPWVVTFVGIGPVHAGMTVAEAEQALGARLVARGGTGSCSYVFVDGKTDIALMVIDGVVARVDVQQGAIKTVDGAGIGDTEARVGALYGDRIAIQPHKYTDGHDLVVRPAPAATDTNYRIIFETDGQKVLRYRSGRVPEVGWVEGCS